MLLGDRSPLFGELNTLGDHSRALLGDGHALLGDGDVLLGDGGLALGDLHLALGDGCALLGDGQELLGRLDARQQLTFLDPQVSHLCSRSRQSVLQQVQVLVQLFDRVRRHLHLGEPAHGPRWDEKGSRVKTAPYRPRRQVPGLLGMLQVRGVAPLPSSVERGHLGRARHTAQQRGAQQHGPVLEHRQLVVERDSEVGETAPGNRHRAVGGPVADQVGDKVELEGVGSRGRPDLAVAGAAFPRLLVYRMGGAAGAHHGAGTEPDELVEFVHPVA